MPSVEETIVALRRYFTRTAKLREDLVELLDTLDLPSNKKDEEQRDLETQIESYNDRIVRALKELYTFPPQHVRHFSKMEEFHRVAPYDKSVFIMTKFPEGATTLDAELKRVISAVQDAVRACGFTPRIASERRYHPGLWDNVEVYLFGCERGVAIVESKYRDELNPNVAMEWGWMRAMGKDVLYLVEKTFSRERADLSGLTKDSFTWDSPDPAIREAVSNWLRR